VATAAAIFHAEELPAAGKIVAIITGGNIETQVLTDILSSHVG
jgi:hypothetical protein